MVNKCKIFIQSAISNNGILLYDLSYEKKSINERKQKMLHSVIFINSLWNLKQQNV